VDGDGLSVELPGPEDSRATTLINRGGEPIAAVVHDPSLREHAELVDSVCAAAALALENERLQAELRARLDELRRSRARIVEATEEERRRIERDLHDGTQQRLVAIAMTLGLAESKLTREPAEVEPVLREAREGVLQALAELRELSQGIHPAVLTERGLGEALRDLSTRGSLPVHLDVELGRRLDPSVEAAAYFVVSEALANAEKHSHATECVVAVVDNDEALVVSVGDNGIGGAVAGGSGLRGLADRVEALGGRFAVSSPPGRGTTVEAQIPCG
jgi:signal transduction histidine kinase